MTDLARPSYTPDRGPLAKVGRRLTQWRVAHPLETNPTKPIVSVTFDDFPKSAADAGARILEAAGGRGTYYACPGMAGMHNETGALFEEGDLLRLMERGHEIGAHTQSHLDCAAAPVTEAVTDIDAGLAQLRKMGVSRTIRQFAYPYGEATFDLKKRLVGTFDASRGILPGANAAGADLMQLRAYELDGSDTCADKAFRAIERLKGQPAWIILFTHDVSELNSGFGVSPAVLERLVMAARSAGADLLTMSAALDSIRGRTS